MVRLLIAFSALALLHCAAPAPAPAPETTPPPSRPPVEAPASPPSPAPAPSPARAEEPAPAPRPAPYLPPPSAERSCHSDSECPGGQVCDGCGGGQKTCIPGCHQSSQCGGGHQCRQVQCIRCPCPGQCES